jgi:hypothetical protein
MEFSVSSVTSCSKSSGPSGAVRIRRFLRIVGGSVDRTAASIANDSQFSRGGFAARAR